MKTLSPIQRLLIGFGAILGSIATAAFAFGPTGHYEVGSVADRILKDHPRAAAEVRAILGDITLAQAGPWADCLRDVRRTKSGEFAYAPNPDFADSCGLFDTDERRAHMIDYARRNWDNCAGGEGPCHEQYHYVNLARQRTEYRPGLIGTSDHDIVQAMNASIAVLRGEPAPAPFSFTRRDALLMLTHLIGDLHQPLHVGSVYLDEDGSLVDPDSSPQERARAMTVTHTRGGNSLIWGNAKRPPNLHSRWDGVRAGDYSVADARNVAPTAGPLDSWVVQWANETLSRSRDAFEGLSFGAKSDRRWPVSFQDKGDYDERRERLQRLQIEKAGARLAQLLVAIWPDQ